MQPGLISIVIVSYNTRDLLRRCLRSVVDSPNHLTSPGEEQAAPNHYEIIVVDNASRDGSADMVAADFPQVQLVRAKTNLGFARATNVGLQKSRGDWLLLLNPDTEVVGEALPRLAAFLATHERAAAVGPSLVYGDGSPQHAAFRFPTPWMTLFDFFPMNHRITNSRLNGRYRTPVDDGAFEVDHNLGAAMMISRRALQEVGPLDDAFFIYCEEVDWSIRAKRSGWAIYQLPSARVVHHAAQSTGQFKEEMFIELWRSRYRLYNKHYSRGACRVHRAIVRAGLARMVAGAYLDSMRGRIDPAQLERRLRAYRAIWSM